MNWNVALLILPLRYGTQTFVEYPVMRSLHIRTNYRTPDRYKLLGALLAAKSEGKETNVRVNASPWTFGVSSRAVCDIIRPAHASYVQTKHTVSTRHEIDPNTNTELCEKVECYQRLCNPRSLIQCKDPMTCKNAQK